MPAACFTQGPTANLTLGAHLLTRFVKLYFILLRSPLLPEDMRNLTLLTAQLAILSPPA